RRITTTSLEIQLKLKNRYGVQRTLTDEPQKAISDAKKISKHKLLVCVLFETSNQYMINDIWANY
ncbi:hypothetical protein NDJ32_16330, partial [Acinetobacter baumannii]|nr:hypothetical protein [Acinetobacter baumannii]